MEARESSRQEIAERLRTSAGDIREIIAIRKINLRDCSSIFQDMMHDVGISDVVDADYCLDRLADLIDPTCHMTDSRWDNGECTWGCICSACGARIEHEYASDIYYCPYCGARSDIKHDD